MDERLKNLIREFGSRLDSSGGAALRAARRRPLVAVALLAAGSTLVMSPVLANLQRKSVPAAPANPKPTAAAASSAERLASSASVATVSRFQPAPGAAPNSPHRAVPTVGPVSPAPSPELAQWCVRLAAEVPGVGQPACRDSGLVPGDGRSVHGVPLWTRDVLPGTGVPRFKVLLLGGIHGDELASVTLAFDWIARSHAVLARPPLPASPGGQRAKSTLADVAWRFVPLLNPDGLLHAPSQRMNAHGVDLNRNFPTADWARDAQPYWIKRTRRDPRRFPGPQPLSEPESRWLLQQIDQFHPDLIVSVHAPYGLLDFDGPPPAPRRLGSLQLDPVGVYPGSLGNYGGLVKQVPVMTLELKNARQVPTAELAAMWNDLQRWIDQQMANPGVQASVQKGASPAGKSLPDDARSTRRSD
jgi:protein MpaA